MSATSLRMRVDLRDLSGLLTQARAPLSASALDAARPDAGPGALPVTAAPPTTRGAPVEFGGGDSSISELLKLHAMHLHAGFALDGRLAAGSRPFGDPSASIPIGAATGVDHGATAAAAVSGYFSWPGDGIGIPPPNPDRPRLAPDGAVINGRSLAES